MANEAVCIEKPTIIRRRTVADATAIALYTVMRFNTGDNVAIASSAADQCFAGISVEQKTASDGIVEIGCAMDGVWDLVDSGAGIALGVACAIGGANLIVTADAADFLNGAFLGYTREAASASERIGVELVR